MAMVKFFGGDFGNHTMFVRCDLRNASNPVEVDCGTGDGFESTQYQCADAGHTLNGLVSIGRQLACVAMELSAVDCDWEEVAETNYELTSTCDDAGNMLAARLDDREAVRVIATFATIEDAQEAKDKLIKSYVSEGVQIGFGCLSIRQSS